MKEEVIDIRKYRKGDIYVDSFTGQSKMEVLEADHNIVRCPPPLGGGLLKKI